MNEEFKGCKLRVEVFRFPYQPVLDFFVLELVNPDDLSRALVLVDKHPPKHQLFGL
jgi:hypothetical protein